MGIAGLEGGSYRVFFFCGSLGTVHPTLMSLQVVLIVELVGGESNSQAVTAHHHGCF